MLDKLIIIIIITIDIAGPNRVPVPPSILPSIFIHGAMDNFDHEENTSSGIGGSHDTILVLFQNTDGNEEDTERYSISQKSTSNEDEGKRSRLLAAKSF